MAQGGGIGRGFAGQLQAGDAQGAVGTGDVKAVGMVRGDGAGRGGGGVVQYVRGVDAQRFSVEGGVGDGRRVVGADFAVKGGDGCVPVKARLGFVEFVRVGGDAVCRLGRRLAGRAGWRRCRWR